METGNLPLTPTEYLPLDALKRSVESHTRCDLYPFFDSKFRATIATELCKKYFIGANRNGNTVYWQVDIAGNVRQAKIIKYDSDTGRRSKEQSVYFAGKKILGKENIFLQQCFFGEHLLSLAQNKTKPVAIAEIEITAVISSVYFPGLVWLVHRRHTWAKWTDTVVCKVNGR